MGIGTQQQQTTADSYHYDIMRIEKTTTDTHILKIWIIVYSNVSIGSIIRRCAGIKKRTITLPTFFRELCPLKISVWE